MPTYNLPANHRYLGPVLWSPGRKAAGLGGTCRRQTGRLFMRPRSSGENLLRWWFLNAPGRFTRHGDRGHRWPELWKNVPLGMPAVTTCWAAALRRGACNGGSPTTQQALAPKAGWTGSSNMDQHLNMEASERAGAAFP